MKIVNLTGHELTELNTGTFIPPSGRVRAVPATVKTSTVAGIPIYKSTFPEIEGLPPREEGTIYVVSSLALNAVPAHRTDVVAPGNVKKVDGVVVGCYGLKAK